MSTNQRFTLSELAKLKIHFIGIGGAGMSGIARIMLAKGFNISGSDKNDSSLLTSLKALGAEIFIGHDAQNLGGAELVIISSAIAETNPELLAAKARSIQVVQRANALAWLMSESTSIAVAGTHGKTTTTAMLTVALQSAGLDPSFAIGGTINTAGTNAHSGSGSIFIAEADESDGSFLAYQPTGAIITNIELDHVDHFADEAAVFEVFEHFVSSIKKNGFLVACGDDPGVKTLLKRINRPDLKILLYGKDESNDFRMSKIALAPTTSIASISSTGKKLGELQLSLPGEHNLLNSLAAFAAATEVGAAEDKLILGLKSFTGTRRRFELKGEVAGVKVIDDYGHHPTELTVTLIAAKNLAQSGRVIVVFQPHRYSRTAAFAPAFATALKIADFTFLLEVYAASEKPISGVSSLLIAKNMSATEVKFEPSMLAVVNEVAAMAKSGDVIITLGAGDVSSLGEPILQALSNR
ncbi:UDP-N-acetylmuramate--alanine ligase [Candidatus Nanopelagicus hibericus]|uniref:UDP-N-acetylmuramate--L-alanine ligase n=1 Tax=Candidatus Nanopelagicus hibericus TaxID=1884915 RepID=A0A249K9K4_9ACTN|nr:UDP-N-acetylmuramate--L-alanine ligase [Candidatus Nanopelagicus hibericus]ASY13426.1 UDP-N-acetylmuramate--alanine ligase [Candidatus Nanopelagicus hibericus]